jgi:hypothetical protein
MTNRTGQYHGKNQLSALLFLLALVVPSLCFPENILFQDDFNAGNADSWLLEEGWQVLEDEGNFVLSSSQHSFAKAGNTNWTDYSLTVRIQ